MKKDWEIKKLGDICELITKGTTPTSIGFDFQNKGINFVKIESFSEDGTIIENKVAHISKECHEALKRSQLQKGDILFSIAGALGRTAIIDESVIPANTNQALAIIRLQNKDITFIKFLLYYFKTDFILKQIEKDKGGVAQQNLSLKQIGDFEIPIPPLEEQKRIVKILDEKFAQLETIKTNAQTNLQNAKDLFQSQLSQAFEQKDCHTDSGLLTQSPKKDFKDFPLGKSNPCGNKWKTVRLGEVCEITSKLVNPTLPEYQDLYHVGGANIESETGILLDLKTSKEEGLSSGKFTFDESMVLYNKIRPYLKKVARPNFAGLCSADMYPLNPKNNITKDFLYYILISDDFTEYAISKSDRAGMPKVNREALFAYECYLPPLPEQKRIVKELDTLSEKVKALCAIYEKQIADCEELKQAYLQKAFDAGL